MSVALSPRDRFLTIYGRIPVLEALEDRVVEVDKVLVAATARGEAVDRIVALAQARGISLQRVAADRVTRVSRNGRQDQGVVADVAPPRLSTIEAWLEAGGAGDADVRLALLDGVTTPANVGMIIRTVTAAGWTAVVVPRFGVAEVGPLVVKASAGVALRAPLLRCPTAAGAVAVLREAGVYTIGLRGTDAPSLYATDIPDRAVFVFGNETEGVSPDVGALIDGWVSLPLAGGVESLNVSAAAAVVAYEVTRRRSPR